MSTKKCTTGELLVKFYWGKMRTAAWEPARQRALRNSSKEAVGESQYIIFW